MARLAQSHFVSARELSLELGASYSTIARDLDRLARHGLLERINGGAAALPDSGPAAALSWAG
jgi:DeoR/GlpR family transcriptional regulator of sugar metabolism